MLKFALSKSTGDLGYSIFGKIKRWANFDKHPKAFMFVHHPEFDFMDSGLEFKGYDLEINQSSVDKYYASASKNSELVERVKNQDKLIVNYPNMRELTSGFCDEALKAT